jgi:hypothetical protein
MRINKSTTEAERIVKELKESGDMIKFVMEITEATWHFGKNSYYNRRCLEEALKKALNENGLGIKFKW